MFCPGTGVAVDSRPGFLVPSARAAVASAADALVPATTAAVEGIDGSPAYFSATPEPAGTASVTFGVGVGGGFFSQALNDSTPAQSAIKANRVYIQFPFS